MDKSLAPGESDLADVALAWKSLQKAKAVLQQIENKCYHQTWSCAKSQAARRKLWNEKSFDGERNRDETALDEKKSNEIPSTCRKGNCAALSPAGSQTSFLEGPAVSSAPSRMSPLSPRRDPPWREAADGEGTAGTRPPSKTLERPRSDNFKEQADSRGCTVQRKQSPCSLQPPPHPSAGSSTFLAVPRGCWSNAPIPEAVLLPTSHLSSASKPSDQRLEELWRKSSQKKLEELKKRIQEQRLKQQTAAEEQKSLVPACAEEPQQKRPLKRKVCRVVSAPPAPPHRDQRKRSSAQRTVRQSQKKPPPKSSALERAVTGTKLPGVSAWREGQKLARKLLGPPPTFPKLRSTAEEQTTANTFEPVRGFVTIPVVGNNFREKGNEPVGKSPEFKNCVAPSSKAVEGGSSAPTKDAKQILRNLHLQSQDHHAHRHTRFLLNAAKTEVGVLQQYLGIHSPSPGPQAITPSAFNGVKRQFALMKDGAKPSSSGNCSRGKNTSPQRQKGSSSPAQKGSGKENLKHPSKRKLNIKKPHPYSPEIVQEFMYRKNEERKKKRLEEKKSLVQAMEVRNKRLQEVYRKQKEAINKKPCSDQMHKLTEETASAKGSSQCKLEQEQSSGGILERSFMAWVDKPCTLLSKGDRDSRNQLLETVQSPKKRVALTSPAPLESEYWFLSPLKCEDLKDFTPPALHTSPLSFSLPKKDAKPYFKDSVSPYRSKQDQVKAIYNLSKELAEKIEKATKRLNAARRVKDSADKASTETTLDFSNYSFSVPEPETSEAEQDRTMTVQMLLDTPSPDRTHVSLHGEFQGLGRISPEGPTALDRQKEIPTTVPGESRKLPRISHSAGKRHLSTGGNLSNTLQGFAVNEGSEVDISLLHEKPITRAAFPSHRFLARSLQRDLSAQRNHCQPETILKVPNPEEIANQAPRESPRTPDGLGSQPPAALSPGAETHHGFEQDFVSAGEGDPSCRELEEKHRSHLDNLRQTSLLLAHRLKAQQLQQKQQLTVLKEKANVEIQESQRFLSDLLQNSSEACSSSKGRDSSVPRLDHAEQMWRGCHSAGDPAAGSNQEVHSLKTERDHSPVEPKVMGERKPLGRRGSYHSVLQGSLLAQHGELLHGHQTLDLLPPLVNLPHEETHAGDTSGDSSEQAGSDSQWSEVSQHYGASSTFCSFSLAMTEQCLRGEELRARHQAALLKLRKKTLREKARAELAWLCHQKRLSTGKAEGEESAELHSPQSTAELPTAASLSCLEYLQDGEGASAMEAKQGKILRELKEEQAEIQHLQNIYKAAHQERKLLLKQQREILMMQHLTAQLQEKLNNLTEKQENKSQSLDFSLTRSPATEEATKLETRLISSPKLCSSSTESTTYPGRPEVSENREDSVQLNNKQSNKQEGFPTENKKMLVQYQKQSSESPDLEQSLGVQSSDTSGTGSMEVCGAASQAPGSHLMIKGCTNTELNAQDHDTLPLEHANSARLDDPRPTPITGESRKCAFLESGLEEKALISNPKIDPQDNEDINPCDSKFTVKGLGMISTLSNLCLVQAENILQGTVKEVNLPVPYESHQVDGSQCLKHLGSIYHDASDEEQNIKAFSEGLASIESLSKSNSSSPRCESAKSDSSLPEFQKVSAAWIDISESSVSDFELELKSGEGTDVSIPEEFVCDSGDVFPNVSKETLTAISDKHDQHEMPGDDSTEVSAHPQKSPGDVSDNGCTDHLFAFIPTNKANASKTRSADSSQSDDPAEGLGEQHLDASENQSRNKLCSEEMAKESQEAAASSSCSDIYSLKTYEQQKSFSSTSKVKKNRINSLFVDQNRELMGSALTGSSEHLDLPVDQFRNPASFPLGKDITNNELLTCLSSRKLSVSEGENDRAQLLNEVLTSNNLSKMVSLSTSMPGISEEVHTETNSFKSLQSVATGNEINSTTERQVMEEVRRGQFSSVSSKNQLFQAENCSPKGEDDTFFISDEGLPPTDEDTLSEILSPLDEVLSYGSADLPSSNKKDLSFPSEDLPPPPLGAAAVKNDDPSFSMDDFLSPPEQMTASESRHCVDEDVSLKMDALSPLPDHTVPEEFPLLTQETVDAFSTQDDSLSEPSPLKDTSSAKEGLLEHHQEEHGTLSQHLEFLPVSNPISSGQSCKNPDFTTKAHLMLPKAEETSDDPLLSFEIGDRVLVKQLQPGTLKFKGQTCFASGHWAGVALDKAEGDHAGTYKGVKYFECAQHCGIFVRPDEISHLLGADKNSSSYTGGEDSDSYDDEAFKDHHKYSKEDEQGGRLAEQKAEDTKSAGGSQGKGNQSRLHIALLSGEGDEVPHPDQWKCNEFLCQNNLMCLGAGKEKTELRQTKQRILADNINTSKNICCLVEAQKRNKLADDIANELGKKLLLDALIAFSETAKHKFKNAFEKDMGNYGKGLRQEDNQKMLLLKENSAAILPEQSAKVSDVLLCGFDTFSIHGCHKVAERIVTKFVADAVKEYQKIKRNHGSKADKIFHSPSEPSPSTLPFLIKILDAGIFGSSEDYDQHDSDQHMLVRQTQNQYLYKSDQWHSAPWKKTVEAPLVIPHYSSYVKKLSAYAVEELWTPENTYSNFRKISVPKHFEYNDLPGNNLETESKRMYNQIIFDLTHELLCAEYQVTANPNTFPWMKENLGSYCSKHLCRGGDVNEVKMFVQGEIIKIMNLEKNDLEMKRKFLNMTKYGNCKRDRVDLILIEELHKEESQWTDYNDDELTVKMRMTEDIFDSLILDTIRVLNKIYLRKACD
ncbi:coiled-coil domain-containing protein 187 isoform X3 [Heliangelus exortis]|uniref:coiled-coil domain-containing protein 187 isoform X3 n=1 Tax=Heliangelus exortis TaxID=472823 RepID=UPI003A93E4C4